MSFEAERPHAFSEDKWCAFLTPIYVHIQYHSQALFALFASMAVATLHIKHSVWEHLEEQSKPTHAVDIVLFAPGEDVWHMARDPSVHLFSVDGEAFSTQNLPDNVVTFSSNR